MKSNRFYYGGALAAHQCEGAWDLDGRGPSVMDVITVGSAEKPREIHDHVHPDCFYPSHEAIDFYHTYKEDIALFAEMGFKVFRMSISWSRLYPTGLEEEPNQKGIEFYRSVFEELRKYGIEPLVTIWHFDTALYLEETLGDWKNRELIDLFVKFARTCFTEFKGLVRYWLTFNEINNTVNSIPEDLPDSYFQDAYQHLHNQFVASAKAVKIGHEIDPENQIGCMICGITYYPHTSGHIRFFPRADP